MEKFLIGLFIYLALGGCRVLWIVTREKFKIDWMASPGRRSIDVAILALIWIGWWVELILHCYEKERWEG